MKRKRIVVKIGSSSLTDRKGEIDHEKLQDHVSGLARLYKENHEVILVSSGAVASGFKKLGYPSKPVTIKGRQAAAAVGQSLLIQSYMESFAKYDILPAQILLTRSDFSSQARYRNAFSTLTELLDRGLLPIINENDSVAIDELTFGDNDMLSALVSGFVHADQLIILTDINGIYDDHPSLNPAAKRYDQLDQITDEMIRQMGSEGSTLGTGGMKSKLHAAKTAISMNVPVFIGIGEGSEKLLHILQGKGDGTYIPVHKYEAINTKRQWIAFHSEIKGTITIDEGAEEAILFQGRSLLPAGVLDVKGSFAKGDVIEVRGKSGMLGKGKTSCSSRQLQEAIHQRQRKNYKPEQNSFVEVIHRNHWVEM